MVSKEEGKISILRDATNGSSSINKKTLRNEMKSLLTMHVVYFISYTKCCEIIKREKKCEKVSLSFNFVGFSAARGAAVVKNKVNGGRNL